MEYKYLVEVLKSGLYEDFYGDFKKACVCFFDPERYGRSILENSSFIVSSAYPYKEMWGKGFAARLSGATVEALNMWMLMVLGKEPFFTGTDGRLCLRFKPALKKEMFTAAPTSLSIGGKKIAIEKDCLAFNLFSSTLVVYHNPQCKDTYADDCRAVKIVVDIDGKKTAIDSDSIGAPLSEAIRHGYASRIDVYFS